MTSDNNPETLSRDRGAAELARRAYVYAMRDLFWRPDVWLEARAKASTVLSNDERDRS